MSELYPKHCQVLERAGLLHKRHVPTLREQQQKQDRKTPEDITTSKGRKGRALRKTIFFCVGQSQAWTEPIHKVIKRLKQQHGLTWLRTSMSYHRFANVRELFQRDLSNKINREIQSQDFMTLPCNCRNKINNECLYNGVCRESIVVYKVHCNITGKIYIGNTQQKLKKRMQQHFTEVKRLHNRGERSDSFAAHFAEQYQNFEEITPRMIRNNTTFSVIWKGNPISTVKTFGTPNCMLCSKERLEILRASRADPNKLINSCNEIYGACRHKARFHRYCKQTSTDEPQGERIIITV